VREHLLRHGEESENRGVARACPPFAMALGAEPVIDIFDDDDEGWEDMPVVRDADAFASGLDEEDQRRYHYQPGAGKKAGGGAGSNATGALIDFDDAGAEWREKAGGGADEAEYTRLRMEDEQDGDEVHLRTRYLFDEDKAMTPLSQMQATKGLLTEAQRVAYVGLCALVAREMGQALRAVASSKDLKPAIQSIDLWALKILGRLYYHMEIATDGPSSLRADRPPSCSRARCPMTEQKMIESLAEHGVQPMDLVPALMTTHTVANPEFDPAAKRRHDADQAAAALDDSEDITAPQAVPAKPPLSPGPSESFQTTTRVLAGSAEAALPGVSTSLSAVDESVTLDIRWTVLCDLFLLLVADSVYDARSRVLLEHVARRLGLGWLDVTKFERRVTDALEMQEGVDRLDQAAVVAGRQQASKKRRYVMMGLATLGAPAPPARAAPR
jgi:hypothetical protein